MRGSFEVLNCINTAPRPTGLAFAINFVLAFGQ